jgi:hypothetical protein
MPNVRIVVARCASSKADYGMRLEEETPGQWVVDWAFPLRTGTAKKEGYDKAAISGSFRLASVFPGCPYCRVGGFFLCQCGRIACWDQQSLQVVCPWCNSRCELGGEISRLDVGTDR